MSTRSVSNPASIVVIGSLNMDLVARTARLPQPGETLHGDSFATVPGGKGANQAVAAARAGAQVAMIGRVGADAYGARLREALRGDGIDCQGVGEEHGVPTGVAMILVDHASQNSIVIVAGGNGTLAPAHIDAASALLEGCAVVVCQLEVPQETVGYALARAHALGKTVILNPAPASQLPSAWYTWVDYLIPNESEAQALAAVPAQGSPSAEQAGRALLAKGVRHVLLTLGGEGVLHVSAEGAQHFPAYPVAARDTTAAGDTFIGAFAAALARGEAPAAAIHFAQKAAALSVTREGAQPSIPYRAEVQAWNP
ncbi:ribokinase [Pseudomonas typographi]|uniref:Ribokinase n=1 Tax=Pseudomonas typographi TaxID=2715964 RepID=A0ABR7Z766_9PSED|nr:ribokinase [Pseudomonas typographi]MBD1553826.1 ribokinase [Pseudomonas typographi]MBD1588520.1 ribokinase [Pseudomonas typographi]MBD1601222.1 ribokinase [Pseudomonas typographi]